MALCRCNKIEHKPKGKTEKYVEYVHPIGYTHTSSICGRNNCENPGLIWLTQKELDLYNQGIRVFSYSNNTTKVKVI